MLIMLSLQTRADKEAAAGFADAFESQFSLFLQTRVGLADFRY